jgi:hypothetical protein
MRQRRRRVTYSNSARRVSQLQALLGIGFALAGLLRAIDPHYQEALVRLVGRLLMRENS